MAKESRARAAMGELEDPEISIAAMCDVLFVLLTFFMAVTSMEILRFQTEVPLPDAADAVKLKERPNMAVIDVLWTPGTGGQLTFEERIYDNPENLAPILGQRASSGVTSAYIRAAKDAQYFFLSRLTKVIAEAGIGNVIFATQQIK